MSLDIQLQIRNQANETRQSLTEVKSWEDKIEARDKELIELSRKGQFGYEQPKNTTRSGSKQGEKATAPKKVEIKKEEKKAKPEPTEKPVKQVKETMAGKGAPGRTYEEWQKIDAKLKMKEEEDEADESAQKETAESHKEKGNAFFKNKNYKLAIREYTKAIKIEPTNSVYYYNRSTAHYSLSDYTEAEKDATEAIRCDSRYVKAFMRRALSREALGNDYGALKDLEAIENKADEIKQIKEKLIEVRKRLGINPDASIKEVREPKVKINEEKPAKKIEIIEEKHEEAPVYEPMPQPKPHTPTIVIEEEHIIDQPKKVQIVEEPTPQPKKVQIVEEPVAQPKKVQIVEEPAPQPKKVKIETEQPKKVQIVEEPKPKKSDDEANKEAMNEALEEIQKIPNAKGQAAKPKAKKPAKKVINIPWGDIIEEDLIPILGKMDPSTLNKSLRSVLDAEIIIKIVKCLGSIPTESAFVFCLELSRNENFSYLIFDDNVTELRPNVESIINAYEKISNAKPELIRECKDRWL